MVSGTVRLIGDLHRRNFEKMQLLQSLQLEKSGFRVLCVSLGVFFWHFKIDEFLTKVSFCIFKILYFFEP